MSVVTKVRNRLTDMFVESIYDNPIVARECRTRLRGMKGFGVMGGYVLLVGAILFIAFLSMSDSGQSIVNQHLGRDLFQVLMWTQTILLALIVPSISSGMLTQEIEKRTFELLVLTRLTAGKIAVGKQFSAFLFSLILIMCSLPLAGICLMLGGVSPVEIIVVYFLLMAWTFVFACIGVFWSSLFNRTATAALMTYATCGFYTLFTVGFGARNVVSYGSSSMDLNVLAGLNPAAAAMSTFAKAAVCNIHLPISLIAFVLHAAIGILLMLVASTHIRFHRVNRALPIRLLLLAITGSLVWLIIGNGRAMGMFYSSNWFSYVTGASTFILVALMAGAGIFVTGESNKKPAGSILLKSLSFRKILTNSIYGGIPFMLIWGVLLMLILGATSYVAANPASIPTPGPGLYGSSSGSTGNAAFILNYPQLCIAIIAMVFGTSCIAFLLSSFVPSRIGAAALTMVFVVFAFAGYGIILSCYQFGGASQSGSPLMQLAAFWPMTPIIAISGDWSNSMPQLWWNACDSWAVTSFVYLTMGAIALLLASTVISKRKLKEEE